MWHWSWMLDTESDCRRSENIRTWKREPQCLMSLAYKESLPASIANGNSTSIQNEWWKQFCFALNNDTEKNIVPYQIIVDSSFDDFSIYRQDKANVQIYSHTLRFIVIFQERVLAGCLWHVVQLRFGRLTKLYIWAIKTIFNVYCKVAYFLDPVRYSCCCHTGIHNICIGDMSPSNGVHKVSEKSSDFLKKLYPVPYHMYMTFFCYNNRQHKKPCSNIQFMS